MMPALLMLGSVLLIVGGGFVGFANGMADTAGDQNEISASMIAVGLGLVGFLASVIWLIARLF